MYGDEAIAKLLRDYEFSTVLDVGCGKGEQAAAFRAAGKVVTTVDMDPEMGADIVADFGTLSGWIEVDSRWPHDLIWCCHCLEHQQDMRSFLLSLISEGQQGSILAITVPPLKHTIVPGHVTLWNAGLLLYNLVLAGVDCKRAAVKSYGYNISVIVPVGPPVEVDNTMSFDKLAPYLPVPVEPGGFEGEIEEVNW